MTINECDALRRLLCALGDTIRDRVVAGRAGMRTDEMARVASHCAADTIYAIDKISERAIADWFEAHWPASQPVEVVMEGVDDDDAPLCFPPGTNRSDTKWKCLIDPIDGTRGIMYDKRAAWALAGLAPQRGGATRLSDICVAVMTEIPTSKQWRADQLSAVKSGGLFAESIDILRGGRAPLEVRPSSARDFHHGFASIAKFFPEGRALTATIEERLWSEILTGGRAGSPTIFDDQYLSTGGQFYELLSGHDRFVADLRPLVNRRLAIEDSLVCHPYDVAAALLLVEAGVVYESPLGGFPDAPLDTTSPISWIGYANEGLARIARPVLRKILGELLS